MRTSVLVSLGMKLTSSSLIEFTRFNTLTGVFPMLDDFLELLLEFLLEMVELRSTGVILSVECRDVVSECSSEQVEGEQVDVSVMISDLKLVATKLTGVASLFFTDL
jgi:hypothetical protein